MNELQSSTATQAPSLDNDKSKSKRRKKSKKQREREAKASASSSSSLIPSTAFNQKRCAQIDPEIANHEKNLQKIYRKHRIEKWERARARCDGWANYSDIEDNLSS